MFKTIVVLLCLLPFLAFGKNPNAPSPTEKLRSLINQKQRPTIKQVRRILGKAPARVPFNLGLDSEVKSVRREVAVIIAELEFVYPEAIIVPLGRDSADLGDMIDAFYQNNGQNNRVRRFNASRETILSASDEQIVEYLGQLGFEFRKIGSTPPFIIIDRTHGTWNSQIVRIRDAVSRVYKRQGGQRSNLADSFNIVSLTPGVGVGLTQQPKQRHGLAQYTFHALSESNPLETEDHWHSSFGEFYRKRSGLWDAEINPPDAIEQMGEIDNRKLILNRMVEMIRVTADPSMLRLVERAAHQLGYDFFPSSNCDNLLTAG